MDNDAIDRGLYAMDKGAGGRVADTIGSYLERAGSVIVGTVIGNRTYIYCI